MPVSPASGYTRSLTTEACDLPFYSRAASLGLAPDLLPAVNSDICPSTVAGHWANPTIARRYVSQRDYGRCCTGGEGCFVVAAVDRAIRASMVIPTGAWQLSVIFGRHCIPTARLSIPG